MSRSQGPGMARHTVDAGQTDAAAAKAHPRGRAPEAGATAAPPAPSNLALGGVPLDPAVRAEMEARFGHSFADVRIHDDARAHRSAAALGAKAYTHGSDVAFAEGRYKPRAPDGKRLLAHELAHVVQQRRGGPPPDAAPGARHEAAAAQAAAEMMAGSGPVGVAGATGVGVACEPEQDRKKKKVEESGPVRRVGPKLPKLKRSPKPVVITDPKKATGVMGEVTTPFEAYSGPEWNHFGGGAETASSRTSLARATEWGDTAGLDFLVQHRRTRRLVLGEQKRLASTSFTNATATTTNLETNINNTIDKLRANLKNVHPDEVANVMDVISRLEQTARAVKEQTSLPEEVVFELTATGGRSSKIGRDYIRRLGDKYKPEFVEHLLERTYIRNPELAKGKARGPDVAGTDADPQLVRARDAMTPEAQDELARIMAGKKPDAWAEQKKKERQARDEEAKRAKAEEKAARAADRERTKAEAKKIAEEAHGKKLEELREAAKKSGVPEAKTKGEKRLADKQMKKQVSQAGKEAQKKYLDEARARAKAAQPQKPAAPAEAPRPAEPVETPKPAAPVETVEPAVPLELGPKGITPKGVVKGAVGVAGGLAAVAGIKDIVKDFKEGHILSGAGKTALFGLSFVGEAAPPLFALGAIMNYWGPRHEAIQKDSFEAGDVFAAAARDVPLLGRSETFRTVVGGLAAAEVAVSESLWYTGQDMVEAVGEGAEIVGGAIEDAYDWLTEGPSMFDLMQAELERRRKEQP